MYQLLTPTDPKWTQVALADFDAFLSDHTSCERKASAVGLSFVVRYPDREKLILPMIQFAQEELEHFKLCAALLQKRGLSMPGDENDPYENYLLQYVRNGREERLLDRLLVNSVIEARGAERLELMADALTDPDLKAFYDKLSRAERGHQNVFIKMARFYFEETHIQERLEQFLKWEDQAIKQTPLTPRVH